MNAFESFCCRSMRRLASTSKKGRWSQRRLKTQTHSCFSLAHRMPTCRDSNSSRTLSSRSHSVSFFRWLPFEQLNFQIKGLTMNRRDTGSWRSCLMINRLSQGRSFYSASQKTVSRSGITASDLMSMRHRIMEKTQPYTSSTTHSSPLKPISARKHR